MRKFKQNGKILLICVALMFALLSGVIIATSNASADNTTPVVLGECTEVNI